MKQNLIIFLLSGVIIILLSAFGVAPEKPGNSDGSLKGTIILSPNNSPVRTGGGLYGRPNKSKTSGPSTDSALVMLVGMDTSQNPNKSESLPVLDQFNQEFIPKILPIPAGSKVRIRNSDPVYHNVFSLSDTKKFDVGRRPRGEYLDVDFNKPGIVDVFCDIHSNMHAIIYVMPEQTYNWKKVQSGQSFEFQGIPDGNYELKIYARGYDEQTITVTISSGQITDLGTLTLSS